LEAGDKNCDTLVVDGKITSTWNNVGLKVIAQKQEDLDNQEAEVIAQEQGLGDLKEDDVGAEKVGTFWQSDIVRAWQSNDKCLEPRKKWGQHRVLVLNNDCS
jgi:hypothetical protein